MSVRPAEPNATDNADPYMAAVALEEFRALIRTFVGREMLPFHDEWEQAGAYPKELLSKLGALGALGLRADPAWGGQGLDYRYTVVLCEELVRSLSIGVAVSILAHAEFAIKVIDDVGTAEQKRAYLTPALAGETVWGLGVTEPGFGSNVGGITTAARRDGGDLVISGSKTFISNGSIADFITLAVRTGPPGPKGISLVILPTDARGFTASKLNKMSVRTSDTAVLYLDECRIPLGNILGNENEGFAYIMDHFQAERLVLSSFANGVMRVLWEMALEYGAAREVFGRSLLDYQSWKHRLADCYTAMLASRQLTYHACRILDGGGQANTELAAAKLFTCEQVKKMASEVLQLHGGYGIMSEYVIARLYRDVAGFTIGAGTSEIMREIIAKEQITSARAAE